MSYADEVKKLVEAAKIEEQERTKRREQERLEVIRKDHEIQRKMREAFSKVEAAITPFRESGAKVEFEKLRTTMEDCRKLFIHVGSFQIHYTVSIDLAGTMIRFTNKAENIQPKPIKIPLEELTVERVEKILLPNV